MAGRAWPLRALHCSRLCWAIRRTASRRCWCRTAAELYREGVAGNPKYLNPLLCDATDVDMDLCALLYRGLTRIDKNGRVVGDLAAEWTIKDGVEYTFRLKPDQYWHDGEPVTAEDVMFTVGVLQDPEVVQLART